MSLPRMTDGVVAVLLVLLEAGGEALYGLELAQRAGVRPGSAYPILQRLEVAGWLHGSWEDGEAALLGRPVRRYYQLTGSGLMSGAAEVDRALRDRGLQAQNQRWRQLRLGSASTL